VAFHRRSAPKGSITSVPKTIISGTLESRGGMVANTQVAIPRRRPATRLPNSVPIRRLPTRCGMLLDMPLLGYARVSTTAQNPSLQLDALNEAGCERIFTDTASGARSDRPELAKALDYLRADDVFVVWRLDRLGRSLPHLVQTMADLEDRKIGFRSLTEGLDTTSAAGRFVVGVFMSLAAFERDLIRERTMAGLAAARARGRRGGRKPAISNEDLAKARDLLAPGTRSVAEVAKSLGCGRSTLYRALAAPEAAPRPAQRAGASRRRPSRPAAAVASRQAS